MIKNTVFKIRFCLSGGQTLIVITEDDGLTKEEYQTEIRSAINDDEFYIIQDMTSKEWIIIRAERIDAFGITDVGPDYDTEEVDPDGGFSFL